MVITKRERPYFDDLNKTWKYAIRGKTIDKEDVRVVVAIVDEMIIITVIRLR